jgi:hypothetical protein
MEPHIRRKSQSLVWDAAASGWKSVSESKSHASLLVMVNLATAGPYIVNVIKLRPG